MRVKVERSLSENVRSEERDDLPSNSKSEWESKKSDVSGIISPLESISTFTCTSSMLMLVSVVPK